MSPDVCINHGVGDFLGNFVKKHCWTIELKTDHILQHAQPLDIHSQNSFQKV